VRRPGIPWLAGLYRRDDVEADADRFPASLPFVRDLDLRFERPVTFFVGENGSGKSTLLEALAQLADLPVAGGGRNELADRHAPHRESPLAPLLRASWVAKPREAYFFRAENQAHFATLLEDRDADPDFRAWGDPYERYGGSTLHGRSHGEAFLAMFGTWLNPGLVLMDEPEAALSPQRQLALLLQMARLAKGGRAQFVIATHSPLFLTFPDAALLSFDGGRIQPTTLRDTSHWQITKGMLDNPERTWRHLLAEE